MTMTTTTVAPRTIGAALPRAKAIRRLAGQLIVQGGVPILLAAMRAAELPQHKHIDILDPHTERGYQRDPSKERINKAGDYYDYNQGAGRMPNPLLVNVREEDFDRIEVTVLEGDSAAYHEAIESGGTWMGLGAVVIPSDLPLWIYDGQHREGGIEVVLDRYKDGGDFDDFPVPLSLTLGLSTQEEMKEFYEVNSNAKSVRTDLAWELLRQLAEHDPKLAEKLEVKRQDWKLRGLEVVKELRKLDGPWTASIQKPNEHGSRKDRLTIAQVQFITALKPVLDMPLLNKAEPEKIAQIVNAYWQGIARVIPEPFDSKENPKNWVIQKGVGVTPLFRALPRVIEVVRARGDRLGDPNAYAEVMKDLPKLAGTLTDRDTGDIREVSGEEFWRSGEEGVASAFTGEAGRARLYIMIQAYLPKPTSELKI